ncbi:hypothetical protein quinque_007343 [Culex quinquefasciatus]
MAKWGEGDPRWIVEERPDATNVNNWHWTEKNATPWSKDKLKLLLQDFVVAGSGQEAKVVEIEKMDGEATANNRKGKLIFFYEWNIVLKWKGVCDDEDVTGKVTIPNLSEENDIDEVELTVSVDSSNNASEKLKQFMYNIGRDKIRKQLDTYVKQLKQDFAKGLILPKKGEEGSAVKPDKETVFASGFNKQKIELKTVTSEPKTVGVKLDVKTFVLFGGNVTGKYGEIVPNKKIVQTWRLKQWPSGHFSNVVMELEEREDHTVLKLTQTLIPAAEFEATKANWSRYYWDSIRSAFGFGSFLY